MSAAYNPINQNIGVWCNGNTVVSKTTNLGSIPCAPANYT